MAAAPLPSWLADAIAVVGIGDVAAAVITALGAVVGTWVFVQRVWPVLKTIPGGIVAFARGIIAAAQMLDSVKGLPAFIERTDTRISEIHHEVHFNNGSSVKDAAVRTERAVAELHETAARLEVGMAGLYTRVDELAAVDDRLWSTIDHAEEEDSR